MGLCGLFPPVGVEGMFRRGICHQDGICHLDGILATDYLIGRKEALMPEPQLSVRSARHAISPTVSRGGRSVPSPISSSARWKPMRSARLGASRPPPSMPGCPRPPEPISISRASSARRVAFTRDRSFDLSRYQRGVGDPAKSARPDGDRVACPARRRTRSAYRDHRRDRLRDREDPA